MVNQQPTNNQTTDEKASLVVLVIPPSFPFHTDDTPECLTPDCSCKVQTIADLTQAVIDGLATPEDATRIMQGKTI